jgi:hypothetical protein
MNVLHRLLLVLVILGAAPAVSHAQEPITGRFLPGVRHFSNLMADPLEPRMGAGLTYTDILRREGGERPPYVQPSGARDRGEVQGDVALGGTLPLLELQSWEGGGLVLAGQAGVTARFRIERPSRDHFAEDWFVALPVEARWGAWSARARLAHISSHLGDEFMEETGAERIEYGGESLDVHVGYDTRGGVRVYGGGVWNFRSYTIRILRALGLPQQDRFVAQAGLDGLWPVLAGGRAAVVGGFDVKLAERTDWQAQVTAVAGVRVRTLEHGLQLRLRVADGPSQLGEFFLTPERIVTLEFVAEL